MDSPSPSAGSPMVVGEPGALDAPDAPDAPLAAPPVVAVVVTTNPGPFLEAALASLRDQDYPALSVLVLDSGSADDPTPRIAAVMPRALVRRLPPDERFAAAANDAVAVVEGAPFLLLCHDDVVLAPDAVRIMVEEAYRSNAAIVGPKLTEAERPEVLLEVGMAIDHYGVPFSAIEPGEVDQEQHDAVRDVFFVSHAAMLVRADLLRELGGFDAATAPGSEAIDLCWRARLAGARVLVAPDARVAHRALAAADARLRPRNGAREVRAFTAARIRMMVKAYSALALVWVLPVAFVLSVAEAVGLVLARRPAHAGGVLAGWASVARGLPDLARARRSTQRQRRVHDGDVRVLMVRGSARVRTFLTQRLHAGDRLAEVSHRTRTAVTQAGTRLRARHVAIGALLALLVLAGSRALFTDRVPAVGGFTQWPGAGALWDTFWSPWRYAMVGADAPGPPAFGLLAALSTMLLGDTDLARTLVVAGAFPLGVWGAYLLARPLAASPVPGVAAAAAYGANPIVRNALAEAQLGPLLLYALGPFLLGALLRAAAATTTRARVRVVTATALLTALAAAFWPPAVLLPVVVGVAFVAATPFAGGWGTARRSLALGALAAVVAVALLVPWSASLVGADAAAFGAWSRRPLAFIDVLAFQTGRAGSGVVPLGLLVAAALALLTATGARYVWTVRAWMLVVVSFALVWIPGRLDPGRAALAPEAVLVPAALGVCLAVGLGVAVFVEELRSFRFGWRQVAAVAAAVGLALPLVGLAADSLDGSWRLPDDDWASRLEWTAAEADGTGGLRVLWLGDPAVLPADAQTTGRVGYATTRDGPGDVRSQFAPPANGASRRLAAAIERVRAGDTVRFGHLVAPAGIRYVAVLTRAAPDGGVRIEPDASLAAGLAQQLDLALALDESGAVVYENLAWLPRRALVDPAATGADPERTELAAAASIAGPRGGSRAAGPGTVLWAEAADPGWRARAGGESLPRADAFGWTNAFTLDVQSSVAIRFDGGARRLLLALQVLAWLTVLVVWMRARREAGE